MKSEKLQRAIGNIDDDLIAAVDSATVVKKKNHAVKWAILAAACIAIVCAAAIGPMLAGNTPAITGGYEQMTDSTLPAGNETGGNKSNRDGGEITRQSGGIEFAMFSKYKYAVDEGKFSTYEMGRGINEKYVGRKLADVTVTAGWVYSNGGMFWKADEHARAEIYEIDGVPENTAVAIRFLEKLEAELTDFFYVIVNPDADNTPVKDYVIEDYDPSYMDDGSVYY